MLTSVPRSISTASGSCSQYSEVPKCMYKTVLETISKQFLFKTVSLNALLSLPAAFFYYLVSKLSLFLKEWYFS